MPRTIALALIVAAISHAQDTHRMDEVVQDYATGHKFMGTVLVSEDDHIIFNKAYGSANLEWDIPNTPETKFRLGSITKQFTAASILLLEERGKLKTTDLVKQYLPDAPTAWDNITVYNLLTHTSGIPNFTGFADYKKWEPFATTAAESVARFRDKPLDFPPGSKFNYSNSGYVLLGYLVEKISGEPYATFVQKNIFTALGMKDSGYDSNSAIIPRRAAGYEPGPDGPRNAGFIHMSIPHGAGALYSTTPDLLRWEQGLFGGKLLTPASLTKMTTPFKNDYGCGLFIATRNGRKVISHGGGIEGFNTELDYYPDEKLTVIALANINGTAVGEITRKLAALMHGETVVLTSERKTITVSPEVLARYPGAYQIPNGPLITVTLEDGHLVAQPAGQRKAELFPESDSRFFLKVIDAEIEFTRDAEGKVTALILHQGGRDETAARR